MNKNLEAVVKRFLVYAFSDVDFKYDQLTDTEKSLCTPAEFEELVAWIRKQNS